MGLARSLILATALVAPGLAAPGARAQGITDGTGMLVVYGQGAATREGDTDRREQIFISVPAKLRDRLYVRLFDPEVSGAGDFTYGGSRDSETTFRIFGGKGAYSEADRPTPVSDGDRVPMSGRGLRVAPVTGPGKLIREKAWGNDRATDGRWVTLGALRAAQGEVIGDRAFFRLDIQGTGGNDGNGYSVDVSLSRDRSRAPEGLRMFAWQPTVRWSARQPATQVWFRPEGGGPYRVQSFDAANGTLSLVTDFADLPVRVSGQDFWSVDTVQTDQSNLALSLLGGRETPNDVTLSVFDASGAPVALQMPPHRAPVPARPTAQAVARPLADCRSVAFDASASIGLTPLSFLWRFGDGATSPEPVIVHRYGEPGHYTARVEVLEDGARPGRGAAAQVPVHVRNAPVAVPGGDIVVAPGQVIGFDGTASVASDSPISRYRWNFGDGTQATGAMAQKAYAAPGRYRAVLRVEDDSDHPCDFGVETRRVTVNAPPVAEAGSDRSAIVGLPVAFSGAASYDVDGKIAGYLWDMGDGTVLEGESVSHAYAGSGQYQVTLTVTDDSGVANDSASDRMRVDVNAPPVPRFTIPPRAVAVSEIATLDAGASTDSDGTILSYIWNFGDGATGEGPVVSYAWTRPGVYNVALTVIDDSGTASALQVLERQVVVDAAPVADAGPDQYVSASEVLFDGGASSDSDGKVTSWEWDFGDGVTASGRQVRHAYLRPGRYDVALVVRDDSGAPLNADRDTMAVFINASPIADAGPARIVAPGEEFVLSGGASVDPDGGIAEYVWDFPDGSSVRGQRAAYAIPEPGLYRIRLRVSDDFDGRPASDEAEVLVTVNAAPVAEAGPDRMLAPGGSLTLDAGQSYDPDGSLVSYRWEFDDLGAPLEGARVERAYMTPGIWSAQLVVSDDSGVVNSTAVDSLSIRVNSAPVADAGAVIDSDRLYVTLDGSGSGDGDGDALIYRWDFGDGSAPAYGQKVTHVYPRSGVYPVTLRVDDGTGLSNARAVDTTRVTLNARPLADAGGNRDVCSGAPILFDASSSTDPDGGLLQYSWDFGDGSGSDLVNPTKIYERPGAYAVTLRVRNETGTARGTAIDRIAALVREGPIADAGGDRKVYANQPVRFDGAGSSDSDGSVNAFAWSFGDGGSGRGEAPVHVFRKPGTYAAVLTITGEATGSCSPLDSDTASITVIAAPELTISGPDRAPVAMAVRYDADLSQLGGLTVTGYGWDFGDGTRAGGPEVSHVFAAPGVYLVTLNVGLSGDGDGPGTVKTVRKVTVNEAPVALIDGPDRVATGQAVSYDASMSMDADGAITGFAWDFGDGGTARGVQAAHRFARAGVYKVSLTVADDAGVANSEVVVVREVTVNAAPDAGLKTPPPLDPGVAVPWSVRVPEGTAVSWLFGDGTGATGASVAHVFDRPGLYPVVVMLDDGRGLANSRITQEVYARVNATPTAMAGPDRVVCPGETVVFDAAASSDPDGELSGFVWEFSDGVTLENSRVERVFDTPADLRVRLSVRDDSGAESGIGTDEARVLVNAAPTVDAGPDITVPVGAAHDVVRFDATSASDDDGQGLRLSWDFGDGTVLAGAVARHRFARPGVYTVTVTARDTTGLACGVGTDSAIVTALERE